MSANGEVFMSEWDGLRGKILASEAIMSSPTCEMAHFMSMCRHGYDSLLFLDMMSVPLCVDAGMTHVYF